MSALDDSTPARLHVFLWKMFGAAHGLTWATNITDASLSPALAFRRTWPDWMLRVQGDVCGEAMNVREGRVTGLTAAAAAEAASSKCFYKPVLFMEEGKHAVAPDLNGDGHLTPIIDLNASHSDAWGIRDSLGTDSRVSPDFRAETFIPRDEEYLRVPESVQETPNDLPGVRVVPAASHEACAPGHFDTYIKEVKAYQLATLVAAGEKAELHGPSLRRLLTSKEFCAEPATPAVGTAQKPRGTTKAPHVVLWQQYNPYATFWDGFNLAYRFDRGVGGSFTIPLAVSPPFIGGWFVPKLNLPFPGVAAKWFKAGRTDRQDLAKSFDLIFMPSASGKVGWYGGGGWEWDRDKNRSDFETTDRGIAWEFGFKLRTVSTRGLLWSGRFGYRFNGTTDIRDQRFVAEAGVGAF